MSPSEEPPATSGAEESEEEEALFGEFGAGFSGQDKDEAYQALREDARYFEAFSKLIPPEQLRAPEPPVVLRYLPEAVREETRRQLKDIGRKKQQERYTSFVHDGSPPAAPSAPAPEPGKQRKQKGGKPPAKEASTAAEDLLSLKERLEARLKEYRQKRNADGATEQSSAKAKKKAERRLKKKEAKQAEKAKRQGATGAAEGATGAAKGAAKPTPKSAGEDKSSHKRKRAAALGKAAAGQGAGEESEEEEEAARPSKLPALDSIHVSGLGAGSGGKPRKGKKASKQQLLAGAKEKQAQLKSLEGTAEGREAAMESAWHGALNRAAGQRVLDDPKLLARSLKKEGKQKEKKTAAWGERLGRQSSEAAAKQARRTENLQERANKKLAKKGRPIKRPTGEGKGAAGGKGASGGERKGKGGPKLARPGFEGRRAPSKKKK